MPLMILLLLILFLIFPIYSASAETIISPTDISYPTEFKVFDTPDDCLGNISLSWKAMWPEEELANKNKELKKLQTEIDNAKKDNKDSSELEKKRIVLSNEIKTLKNKISIEGYAVYIDKSADGKFEQETARFSSTAQWKSDKEWPFWVSGTKEGYHYVEINVPDQFSPPTQEELNSKKGELQKTRSAIEKAKNEHKDYTELNIRKLALLNEVKLLQKKVGQEEDEIKSKVYYFKVNAVDKDNKVLFSSPVLSAQTKNNWFNFSRLNNFMVMIFFCGLVLWFISHAKKNQNLFLRRIAGLDAVEEAVGRATEMGRSVFYMTGIYSMDDIATICATVILGKVSEKIAQYDSQIKIPHRDPIVMTVCQEIVKEAYTKAGRPDAYKEDCNFYVTHDQFAYTSAVNGMMIRERPAATFFMGSYAAEALLLTECGSTTGAIQIAGSDSTDQLPFFITTCDYTLIGEEFYAASAYLSRQPVLVGTLKAQDIGKVFILIALVVGTTFATLYMPKILDLIRDFS